MDPLRREHRIINGALNSLLRLAQKKNRQASRAYIAEPISEHATPRKCACGAQASKFLYVVGKSGGID